MKKIFSSLFILLIFLSIGYSQSVSKGYLNVELTQKIQEELLILSGSEIEINGILYTNTSDVSINGSILNNGYNYIAVIPDGTSFIAYYTYPAQYSYDRNKRGFYYGSDRVVAFAYNYNNQMISRNILYVQNKRCEINIDIYDWNMDTDMYYYLDIPITDYHINYIQYIDVIIRIDGGGIVYPLERMVKTSFSIFEIYMPHGSIYQCKNSILYLLRVEKGVFDNTSYNALGYRGNACIEFLVE